MKLFHSPTFSNKTILVLLCFVWIGCAKNDGTTTIPTATEDPIVFKIDPDPGSSIMAALASTQDFTVTVSSKLPSAGIKVDLTLSKDLDGSIVFSRSLASTTNTLTATFQNLSSGIVCTGTIQVSSASSAANYASKIFKIAKK